MKRIPKTIFKKMHESNELKLIASASKPKEVIYNRIKEVEKDIEKYTKPTSSYGDISTSKDGSIKTDIYMSDCENYVFVESLIDNSKNRNCSWDTKEVNTIAYLSC